MKFPRANPLREALRRGRLVRGPFQFLRDEAATEAVLGAGFDFVLVDGEHRPFGPGEIERLVRAAQGVGPERAAVVRVPMLARGPVQHALEAGADGILFPLVNSRAEALEAVALSRYPPLGTRGLNVSMRASGWGALTSPSSYVRRANRELLVAVQVETVRALEAVEEIAAVPGVDMLFVGPMDLSHSLGLTGRLGHPLLRAAIRRIFAAGRRRGRWLGVLAPDRAFAAWCVRRGARFLAYAGDVRFLTGGARAALASLDSLARPGKVQARRGAR